MQQEDVSNVPEWFSTQQKEKVNYKATMKFQENWAAILPWAEFVKGGDKHFNYVHYKMFLRFVRKF